MMTFWHDWFSGNGSDKIQGRREGLTLGAHQVQEEPGALVLAYFCSLDESLQATGSWDLR